MKKFLFVLVSSIIAVLIITVFLIIAYFPQLQTKKSGTMEFLMYSPIFDTAEFEKLYDVFGSDGLYIGTVAIRPLDYQYYDHQNRQWVDNSPFEGNVYYWQNSFGWIMKVENR
jgi:hypothetical protein